MLSRSSSAILLRRLEYGEDDLIVTFLTRAAGKISMMAKYARKSRKRFPGILELFSEIGVVGSWPKKGGLPILREAWLIEPFAGIRGDLERTAYASYWSELVLSWLEEGKAQEDIYLLLRRSLDVLNKGGSPGVAGIVFLLGFLQYSGLSPDLSRCSRCRTPLDRLPGQKQGFDLAKGGLLCQDCRLDQARTHPLSPGTIKQLIWIQSSRFERIGRLRFSDAAARESLRFLEAFVPYHLGREQKSLKFLNHIRKMKTEAGNGGNRSRYSQI
jgi:DNA repair protein RecO (recombination protein O)